MGFLDVTNRYAGLDAKADPLVKLAEVVPWEAFRPRLETVWRASSAEGRSKGGRKPWDAVVIFKMIVLCALYNLSDQQVEYQVRDRLLFMRFLGLGLEDRVPDATTVWLCREQLVEENAVEDLFAQFDADLRDQGFLAMGGQMINACIVPVPKQRNTRAENAKECLKICVSDLAHAVFRYVQASERPANRRTGEQANRRTGEQYGQLIAGRNPFPDGAAVLVGVADGQEDQLRGGLLGRE